MAEALTFANYRIDQNNPGDIYRIGADEGHPTGVVTEIAAAFEHELDPTPSVDNLGELMKQVGPAKELQENIGLVQEVLGTNEDAVTIARGWAERSGLLVPVNQYYVTAKPTKETIDLAVITGGVRGWMKRRDHRFLELGNEVEIKNVALIAGNRVMKTTEGEDVTEGMTEADYMGEVIMREITADGRGVPAILVTADTDVGDQVMEKGAEEIVKQRFINIGSARIAVISNAGAWTQNAGQFRRAVRNTVYPYFDNSGVQLTAVSDSFKLGTGAEPKSTHQNPFSAAGQIIRNAQELVRHAA